MAEHVRVTVQGITQEGLGVAIVVVNENGKRFKRPLFLPFAAPGDVVEATIDGWRKKYAQGTVLKILEPSAHRTPARCPHFTICGGCNLQHVAYDEQLRQKAQQITFLLQKRGVVLPSTITVLPAQQRTNYRWRSRIAMRFEGEKCTAGFRKFHSRDIVRVHECFIVSVEILDLIKLINNQPSPLHGLEIEILAVRGAKGKLGVLVPLDDIAPEQREAVKEFFGTLYAQNRTLIGNLFFAENRVVRNIGQVQDHLTYTVQGLTFTFLPETFIQANIPTNELLVTKALEFLFADEKMETVIDLYAGIGNFSLPAAKKATQIIAVEGHEPAVLAGRANALQNQIANVTFLHRSTERYVEELTKYRRQHKETAEYPKADGIIIDPPRTGCTLDVLQGLLESGAKKILYISCNPITLAHDAAILQEKYALTKIIGVDMFPDISHVEVIALFMRKDP